ncbi:Uma2 family endonuclease [Blautia schinkii]|nr:Uma2 family endonuclease [Blautia schinkii]
MTIEEMKERKRELGYTFAQISEYSGVPLGTVQKIFNGETKSPRYETIQALEKVLKQGYRGGLLREKTVYRVKRKYTVDDYYNLPDDHRVELIDGEFYDMAAPSIKHQNILMDLSVDVVNFIRQNKGKCSSFAAPTDVQLDQDDNTMIQPDFFVVCDEKKITDKCIVGAPDFIVEILSPSTKEKDARIKAWKYRDAGVREYWMVDLEKEKVIVYLYEEDIIPTIYGFDTPVPVHIYDDKLHIKFKN